MLIFIRKRVSLNSLLKLFVLLFFVLFVFFYIYYPKNKYLSEDSIYINHILDLLRLSKDKNEMDLRINWFKENYYNIPDIIDYKNNLNIFKKIAINLLNKLNNKIIEEDKIKKFLIMIINC